MDVYISCYQSKLLKQLKFVHWTLCSTITNECSSVESWLQIITNGTLYGTKNWSESSDFQKLWHLWNHSPEHAHGERRISRKKTRKHLKLCAFFISFRFSLRFVFGLNIPPVSKSAVHRKMSTNEYQLEYWAYLNQLHIYFTAGIMTIG